MELCCKRCGCNICLSLLDIVLSVIYVIYSIIRTCGAVSGFQSFTASLFQSFIAPAVLFQSSRFHRLAVSEFQSFSASLFQGFKVSPLRCFRVSKFHRFAVSEFHRTCPIPYFSVGTVCRPLNSRALPVL